MGQPCTSQKSSARIASRMNKQMQKNSDPKYTATDMKTAMQ